MRPFERFQTTAFVDSGDDSHSRWLVVGVWGLVIGDQPPTTNHQPPTTSFFIPIRMRQTPAPGGFDDAVELAVSRVPAQVTHDLVRACDQHRRVTGAAGRGLRRKSSVCGPGGPLRELWPPITPGPNQGVQIPLLF